MSTEINIKKRIDIQEEGVSITPDVSSINFIGAGVTASTVGDNVTVNVQGTVGSTAYYLNETIAQAPYKEFSSIPTVAAEQTIATVVASGATVTIQSFQTPSSVPNTTNIPAGLWQFYLHFSGTAGNFWDVYAEVYKRNLGGVETLLLTTDTISTTALSAIPTMILTDGVFPASTVLTTDRIVVKILATNTGGVSQTITFHTEGSTNYSVGTTTLNQVVPTGAVTSVTGTAPIVSSGGTTPAISMPQANGSTDGYLDSADWTTFNSKQDTITLTTTGTSGAATFISNTLNIPQYIGGLTYFTEAQSTAAPNATVNVDSLTAVASTTNADIAIVPKGTGAFMLDIPDGTTAGGNKRGARAIDLSMSRGAASWVASGADSIVIGTDSSATASGAIGIRGLAEGGNSLAVQGGYAAGNNGIAIGTRTIASGAGAVALQGLTAADSTASGSNSLAFGGATASGLRAVAIGTNAISNGGWSYVYGKNITANGVDGRQVRGYTATDVGVIGDTQKSEFFLGIRTTGNTATTLTVGGGGAGTANQVILSNNAAYGFTGTIIGKQSGSTNAVMWKVEGLIARGANAASTVLTTSTVTLVSNAPAWGTPTLAADTTNGGLRVRVVGAAATNIQWTAVIDTTEVIYA